MYENVSVSTDLDLVQHGAGLLQGHRRPLLVEVGVAADLLQPAPQLVRHLPVVLPLHQQAVDDAPPLLRPPHHALPLVAQQRQLQAEVLPVGTRKFTKVTTVKTVKTVKTSFLGSTLDFMLRFISK